MVKHIPNAITVLRIFMVLPIAYFILQANYPVAFVWMFIAGFSDCLDGFIARQWHLQSKLGAILDPLADKAMMIVCFVTLAMQGLIPVWLAVVVVARDINIVTGVIAWKHWFGEVDIEPSIISKINTAMQIGFILLVTYNAVYPQWLDGWLGLYLPDCFTAILVSTLLSWFDYGWKWWHRAWQQWIVKS